MPHRSRIAVLPALTALTTALGITSPAVLSSPAVGTDGEDRGTGPIASVAQSVIQDGGESYSVTLVTGDVVQVQQSITGGGQVISVDAAPRPDGQEPAFAVNGSSGGTMDSLTVIPSDATDLVTSGQVDAALFDVSLLHRFGYGGDAGTPIIATFGSEAGSAPSRMSSLRLEGTNSERRLESVDALATIVEPDGAGLFWESLQPDADAPAARTLAASVDRILLDRPVEAHLENSVPQVRAPEAWADGFDGTGIQVAVLDTGIDASHPDIVGKVTQSRSFVPGEDVADGHGHGTHVASIIAGSGAASEGAQKGVAPGAELLVGKVLNNDGNGSTSWIIDGMEWATAQGADVVNLSLGGDVPASASDDLLARAVDSLSKESGALFVVAAGNNGPGDTTLQTPGVALSALTVGAVDSRDAAAWFSSRGPVPQTYDHVLKPDMAAPGVDIVAARAAGTSMGSPVNDFYTSASGTSMATPHVAGAAAILAQAHPKWSAAQIKGGLVGSVDPTSDPVFDVGTGRLDVARAVENTVSVQGSLDFGRSSLPDSSSRTRTVTFSNDGEEAATLLLTAQVTNETSGASLPADRLSLPESIAVEPGSSTAVEVVMELADLPEGNWVGTLTATSSADEYLTVAMGHLRSPKTTPVRVQLGSGCGIGCLSSVSAFDLDNPGPPATSTTGELDLRPGTYSFSATASFTKDTKFHVAALFKPEVTVLENPAPLPYQVVSLPLAEAHEITVATDRPAELNVGSLLSRRSVGSISMITGWLVGQHVDAMHTLPTTPVTKGEFLLTTEMQMTAVPLKGEVVGQDSFAIHPRYAHYAPIQPRFPARVRTDIIDVGRANDPAALGDLNGKIALVQTPLLFDLFEIQNLMPDQVQAVADAGAVGILGWSTVRDFGVAAAPSNTADLPVAGLFPDEALELRARLAEAPVTISLESIDQTPYRYSLKFYETGSVPSSQDYKVSDNELSRIPTEFRSGDQSWRRSYISSARPDLGERISTAEPLLVAAPAQMTTLVGPVHEDQIWTRWVGDWDAPFHSYGYRASTLDSNGKQAPEIWDAAPRLFGAAMGHSLIVQDCTACRTGDELFIRPTLAGPDPLMVTGGGRVTSGLMPGPTTKVSLYTGEEEIPRARRQGWHSVYSLPAEQTKLRLVIDDDAVGGRPAGAIGASLHSEWSFASGAPTSDTTAGTGCPTGGLCGIEQLLQIRLQAELDPNNLAARRGSKLHLVPYYESTTTPKPALKDITVQVSFDDGATWETLKVRGGGPGETRSVHLPSAPTEAETVSLRISAEDAMGNTVLHELPRAFGLAHE